MSKYTYDAWEKGLSVEGSTAIANVNPIRYRSCYYDTETGLYFLKTRYDDPEIGRFITIDDISYLAPKCTLKIGDRESEKTVIGRKHIVVNSGFGEADVSDISFEFGMLKGYAEIANLNYKVVSQSLAYGGEEKSIYYGRNDGSFRL